MMNEIEDNMAAVTSAPGNSCQNLVSDLRIDLENLEPPLSPECCIYRVPTNLRKVNEAAYTPQFVSIGPLHYGDENLRKMEKHKLRYLERFLERAEESGKSLEDFVAYVKVNEKRVRRCYAETFDDFNSDEFARMILVDASFIIEHILRQFPVKPIYKIKEGHQLFFDIPLLRDAVIFKDLTLLENQLPFFVLEGLYGMACEDGSFSENLRRCFTPLSHQNTPMPKDFKHFTDLLRHYQLPETQIPTHSSRFSDCLSRLSKVLQRALQGDLAVPLIGHPGSAKSPEEEEKEQGNFYLLYSATELHEAGVTFKESQSKCLFDIKFTPHLHKGVLEMPRFAIDDNTEAVIRNVMALEQCHYPDERRVCEYFILMDCLINTDKDVDLLVQTKILDNKPGSNQEVASLVNKLGLEIGYNGENSCFVQTIRDLNAYYEVPYHKSVAVLRHDYFSTPLRSASTIAACILLLLTLAQTIFSFLSL